MHTKHKGGCPSRVSHVVNQSALGAKTNEVYMYASIIDYFYDTLYVVVLMYTLIVSCGDFRWLSLGLMLHGCLQLE